MALFYLLCFTLICMIAAQTTPTPLTFNPRKYNNIRATNPGEVNVNGDFTDEGDSQPPEETVLYVEKSDYDESPESAAETNELAGTEARDSLALDADRYADFGGFGSAELYRLLALGPQQSDPGMNMRLTGLLDRMSAKTKAPIDNIDHCPDRPEIGIQYYCMKLENGLYFDPWNPWCGYIMCTGGVAERVCCKQGTWLGPIMMSNFLYKTSQKEMCRRPLHANIQGSKCPLPSTKNICKTAIKVEKMNPPKKKAEVPMNPFTQEEIARFTRFKAALASSPEDPATLDEDMTADMSDGDTY